MEIPFNVVILIQFQIHPFCAYYLLLNKLYLLPTRQESGSKAGATPCQWSWPDRLGARSVAWAAPNGPVKRNQTYRQLAGDTCSDPRFYQTSPERTINRHIQTSGRQGLGSLAIRVLEGGRKIDPLHTRSTVCGSSAQLSSGQLIATLIACFSWLTELPL